MNRKQSSDHMNKEKAAGTYGAGHNGPRKESAPNGSPSTAAGSAGGSSQGSSRGKDQKSK